MHGQDRKRPVTRSVEAEGLLDQRSPIDIKLHPASLAAHAVDTALVDIAEWSLADRAAQFGFLRHTFEHFVGQVLRIELSDRTHDAVHQQAGRCLVDLLAGRHQPDMQLVQDLVDPDIVSPVAGQPVDLMDDQVVDRLALFFEVGDHLLDPGPVQVGAGLSWVNEFFNHQGSQRLSFLFIGLPLSGDGKALGPAAALGLFLSGNTQIDDRPLGCKDLAQSGERIGACLSGLGI
ncbi:MAG: hypothetical protein LKF88_05970 [Microbacteriaceae bacterium]|nr:hypothetical protein [Microbacteriaceae bacterium]